MKKITKVYYQCEICGQQYLTKEDALECESKPITKDKGVMVGDEVLITRGGGEGKRGKVTFIKIVTKDWGHHFWTRYWHTVALEVDVINSYGCRFLTFEDYKVIPAPDIV